VSVVLAGAKIRGGGCRVKAGEGTAQQCRVVKPGRRVSTGVSHLFITSWLAVQTLAPRLQKADQRRVAHRHRRAMSASPTTGHAKKRPHARARIGLPCSGLPPPPQSGLPRLVTGGRGGRGWLPSSWSALVYRRDKAMDHCPRAFPWPLRLACRAIHTPCKGARALCSGRIPVGRAGEGLDGLGAVVPRPEHGVEVPSRGDREVPVC
jgi:hypothetical protein